MKKNMYIGAAVAVVVIIALIYFGFFNFNRSTQTVTPAATNNSAQALLDEIRSTGTVAALRVVTTVTSTSTERGAVAGDTVSVNYVGVLPDGTMFDASANHGGPFSFILGIDPVIQGWQQGIVGMKVGERRLLAIPPALGYGDRGQGAIPPNSTLLFDVEMVQIEPAE
ncbi:MAG: FKBP-type peptidyl-prolyl cis-trans isomerase [Patescibacteria group bacterium]